MSRATYYQKRIADMLKFRTNAGLDVGIDPRHIEAWMRSNHGTLDHLNSRQFGCAFLSALKQAHAADDEHALEPLDDLNEELAQSYGL